MGRPVKSGSVHGLTAARRHVLPFLYPLAAREGIVTCTDQGYQDAGVGVIVPLKGANPALTTERATGLSTCFELQRSARTRC